MIRSLQYAFIAIIVTTVGFSLYQWNASRASTQKTAPNNGLVGYWSFNEGTGTKAGDASGNGNTGTLTNGPTWVSGKLGQAVNLDGGDDYIAIPENSVLYLTNNLTISAWVYYNGGGTPATQDYILDGAENVFNNGYSFYKNPNETIALYAFGTSCTSIASTGAIPVGAWAHTSVTYDGSNMKIYINGTLDKTVACTGSITNLSTTRRIGAQVKAFDQAGHFWSGQIDEVRVYNRALSGTEVTNLYNLGAEKLNVSPVSNLTSGLVGYWTFDGKDTPWTSSSAGTATDKSGNGNTGTLTNMSRATTPTIGKLGQALNFDGSNDYVNITHSAALNFAYNQDFSVNTWVKIPSTQNNTGGTINIILNKWNNTGAYPYVIRLFNQTYGVSADRGKVYAARYDGSNNPFVISSNALNDNVWHLISFIKNGSTLSFFVDGALNNTATDTTTGTTTNAHPLYIGTETPSVYPLTGQIDDTRIYNRALSAGEVQSLYDLGASDKVNSSVSQNQGVGRLDSGLVGYWKLDDASGTTATDSSVNANSGTLTGGPTWGTGRIGSAVDFTGTEYITIPNSTPLRVTRDMTASFWMYLRGYGGGGWNPIICKFSTDISNEFNIRFQTSSTGQFYSGDGGAINTYLTWDPSADVGLNNWVHVVARRNITAGTMDMWFNGIKKRSGGASGTTAATTQPLQFGGGPNGGAGGVVFDGLLDEVRIYNRAISDDEISQLYRLTAPTGVDTSLKGYWSFNGSDLSGTTAYDRSGNGNNGTLTNGPTKTIGKLGQALNFDGTDDYVNAGTGVGLNPSAITMSAWVNARALSNPGGYSAIYNKRNGGTYFQTVVKNNGKLAVYIGNPTVAYDNTGVFTLSTNKWYHIVTTYDSISGLNTYVDGVLDKYVAPNGILNSNAGSSQIGTSTNDSYWFNGQIDEVRIYNRALSSTEVSALYNAGR